MPEQRRRDAAGMGALWWTEPRRAAQGTFPGLAPKGTEITERIRGSWVPHLGSAPSASCTTAAWTGFSRAAGHALVSRAHGRGSASPPPAFPETCGGVSAGYTIPCYKPCNVLKSTHLTALAKARSPIRIASICHIHIAPQHPGFGSQGLSVLSNLPIWKQ